MVKWIGILDPRVIRIGMQCRSCLDWDSPMDTSDDGDIDDINDYNWFEAIVVSIEQALIDRDDSNSARGYKIEVKKKSENSFWSIFLHEDNLEYFEIKLNAWDE